MAAEESDAAAAPARKKKGGLVKILLLVVVLGGGGAGAAWWFTRGASAAPVEVKPEDRGLVSFEPFLVNLSDAGGTRFLKMTIDLVVGSPEEAKHIEDTPVLLRQARSAILELLTQQQAPALVTSEGKQKLKDAIKAQASLVLPGQKVIDVLFSEFVVQF